MPLSATALMVSAVIAVQQNPSPMVEGTRAHERLTQKALEGTTRSFVGPGARPVELWIPDRGRISGAVDLVVHFHGAAWLPQQAVSGLGTPSVAAVVNLGAGSGGYHRAFADPAAFDSLLAGIAREISAVAGKTAGIGRVTLAGFSAGHGAIRAILLERRHFAKVGAVLLLDGMHTAYVPEGSVLDKGGALDTTNLVAFAQFARAAMRGEKRFLVTHSEIFPGTFASTTETADWLLRSLALRRTPVLRWGPRGMQQLSEVRTGQFELLGFAGNSAPDHVDHLHAMPELLARTLGSPIAESGTNGHDAENPIVRREVALTFDDIPGVAMPASQRCNRQAFVDMQRKLLRTITLERIPALGLVVEGRLCEKERGALPGILNMWLDAGAELGNHSFSHLDINTTPLARYQADVVRGEAVTIRVLRQRGKRLQYFRHPFLHAGTSLQTKRAFEQFLTRRGYRIAPVTIDNQEWVFAEVYAKAKERGDVATADRVATAYIAHMDEVFDFFERLSVQVVGYEMKQVLLLHANPLNADHLERLVKMMKGRGYGFISIDKALDDPAYRLPDTYAGPKGLSWIHRWASTKGMSTKEEPREPEFIARLFRNPAAAPDKSVRHYVFFGQDREKIATTKSFLETPAIEGAQVAYTWRQLEPEKDAYDFARIREDLAFLRTNGKKLFVQLQDVSFSASRVNVPAYLLSDPIYNGGAAKQYEFRNDDENQATVAGWTSRRWDPAVQARFHKLLDALGKEFDGRIEGINFAETSIGFGTSGRLFPQGFSFEKYPEAIITNMKALKRAFPKSVAMQYGNFMPGEWRPTMDKGYLRAVYAAAVESGVAMGGPDLMPHRPGQMGTSYPLIREVAGKIPTGIAVQDGNLAEINPATGKPVQVEELVKFATEYLKLDYIFWGTEEPYFSEAVVPFLRTLPGR